mmetsp:Transcript_92733/g.262243  ORF Transcript_92733/g.262243 Transcript_92733/m.262243 type:complete len:328 (+) Transcript_92733:67-1050(+)
MALPNTSHLPPITGMPVTEVVTCTGKLPLSGTLPSSSWRDLELQVARDQTDELLVRQAPRTVALAVRLPELGARRVPALRHAAFCEHELQLGQAGLAVPVELEVTEVPGQVRGGGHVARASGLGMPQQRDRLLLATHALVVQVPDVVCHLEDVAPQQQVGPVCGVLLVRWWRSPIFIIWVGIPVPLGEQNHLEADKDIDCRIGVLLLDVHGLVVPAKHCGQHALLRQQHDQILLPQGEYHNELDADKLADRPDSVHPLVRVLAFTEILEQDEKVIHGPKVRGGLNKLHDHLTNFLALRLNLVLKEQHPDDACDQRVDAHDNRVLQGP